MIEPGTKAPGFTLFDQNREKVSLSDFRGRKVLLVFYPADFSDFCSNQMSVYQEVLGEIEERGVQVLGISVDSFESHRAFREQLGLEFPLLSDFHPKAKVSSAYGAHLGEIGINNRSLVMIDEEGIVRWVYEAASLNEVPGANLIFDALEDMSAA